MGMNPSDRKKLLALPFYLAKRVQFPEPRNGQKEMKLFEELTGKSWYDDVHVGHDEEKKITEFDYEEWLTPEELEGIDTRSNDFKK